MKKQRKEAIKALSKMMKKEMHDGKIKPKDMTSVTVSASKKDMPEAMEMAQEIMKAKMADGGLKGGMDDLVGKSVPKKKIEESDDIRGGADIVKQAMAARKKSKK